MTRWLIRPPGTTDWVYGLGVELVHPMCANCAHQQWQRARWRPFYECYSLRGLAYAYLGTDTAALGVELCHS